MIEPTLKYISEPSLTFGNGQTAIDPRDGLMLFGPFDHKRIKGVKNIGIIGPSNLRGKMIDYLKGYMVLLLMAIYQLLGPIFQD